MSDQPAKHGHQHLADGPDPIPFPASSSGLPVGFAGGGQSGENAGNWAVDFADISWNDDTVFGYDVTTAAHGQEALELFLREPHDLVLTDLMMPGMSGWELAAHLRAADPRLPVVILTGFGANLEEEARHRGIVLMHKPVRLESLAATLGQALGSRGVH